MIIAQSGAQMSYERGCFTPPQMFIYSLSKIIFVVYHKMVIVHSELYFGVFLVVSIFFFRFLSNNYKDNKIVIQL